VLNHISLPNSKRIVASPLLSEFLVAVSDKPLRFKPARKTLQRNDPSRKTAEIRPVKLGWLPLLSSGRSSSHAPESSKLRVQLPKFRQLQSMLKAKEFP
jgi:hypothetical protein